MRTLLVNPVTRARKWCNEQDPSTKLCDLVFNTCGERLKESKRLEADLNAQQHKADVASVREVMHSAVLEKERVQAAAALEREKGQRRELEAALADLQRRQEVLELNERTNRLLDAETMTELAALRGRLEKKERDLEDLKRVQAAAKTKEALTEKAFERHQTELEAARANAEAKNAEAERLRADVVRLTDRVAQLQR